MIFINYALALDIGFMSHYIIVKQYRLDRYTIPITKINQGDRK